MYNGRQSRCWVGMVSWPNQLLYTHIYHIRAYIDLFEHIDVGMWTIGIVRHGSRDAAPSAIAAIGCGGRSDAAFLGGRQSPSCSALISSLHHIQQHMMAGLHDAGPQSSLCVGWWRRIHAPHVTQCTRNVQLRQLNLPVLLIGSTSVVSSRALRRHIHKLVGTQHAPAHHIRITI